jgi:uncharacterized protein (TIGR02145 family)/uncharacterized repeat protein (TIGR02543 family)
MNENLTLTANFWPQGTTPPEYTVTYYINGGSGTTPSAQTISAGTNVTLASGNGITKTGYMFDGWNTNIFGTGTNYNAGGASYTFTYDITLYAKWTAPGYTGSYGTLTDNRDSKQYKTVKIGTQTWMAENLNYVADSSWCYDNSPDSCNKYGRLYDWSTVMDIGTQYNNQTWGGSDVKRQGVCPSGWHLPSRSEWDVLAAAVGGKLDSTYMSQAGATYYYWNPSGMKLKSTSGWKDGGNGTDDFGFSALPGGSRYYNYGDGSFSFTTAGSIGSWWTATESNSGSAYHRIMDYLNEHVLEYYVSKSDWLSVRCVQD